MSNRSPFQVSLALLFLSLLVLSFGCGPNNRGPFVGVWRLDAEYFKEQLEKQELKSDVAKEALDQAIPLWTSFKVEYTFSANGRYKVASQFGAASNVAVEQGVFEVVSEPNPVLRFTPNNQSESQSMAYRFIDDNTLELDVNMAQPGYPKTARFLRSKADEATVGNSKKAAP